MHNYEIILPDRNWVSLPQKHFREAGDGTEAPQETLVRLRHDGKQLSVEFECYGDRYWRQNTYEENNAPLWKQEVFEIFIARGDATPTHYLELEINPNDALFVGRVHNPGQTNQGIELTMVPPEETGIAYGVTRTTSNAWWGELHIPFALIDSADEQDSAGIYRINFYRIVLLESQTNPDWECSPENSSFQCWSPTMSGDTPSFHRPERFGILRLL
ncbi:carbohydrate-binding family 9-like protein [Persicitalea jodogahamensis]|uniref:Carbohydrate-binding domain-containing protein n=1 Tax=Persicitalea jodogahamensis TaxID=402147 RepID=A0A8J3G7N7_9BACT|nr:carbohydrate-binding family 9-like protein [Persicitalea jodogahamensis]GHB57167.1 hypothetical protein GCM10007390_08230 [Persicitalea jodogahamensis]